MTEPNYQLLGPEVYQGRAANVAKPADYVELTEPRLASLLRKVTNPRAASANTFYNDVSEFQTYVNSSYRYPMISTRIDNGWNLDNKIWGNRTAILNNPKIQVWQNYCVYKPGYEDAQLSRIKNFHGTKPPAKLVFMIDMESGDQFAGPGNHSAGANRLADNLADYLGSRLRVSPYANKWDFINNWPGLATWLEPRKVVASYGAEDPGSYGWQYYGALPFGVAAGYPTYSPPFGSYVDFNVIHRSINQILVDFGLRSTDWFDMASKAELQTIINATNARVDRLTSTVEKLASELHSMHELFRSHDGQFHQVESLAAIGAKGWTVPQARHQWGVLEDKDKKGK